MIFEVDTEEKTIKMSEEFSICEFSEALEELLSQWKTEYKLGMKDKWEQIVKPKAPFPPYDNRQIILGYPPNPFPSYTVSMTDHPNFEGPLNDDDAFYTNSKVDNLEGPAREVKNGEDSGLPHKPHYTGKKEGWH